MYVRIRQALQLLVCCVAISRTLIQALRQDSDLEKMLVAHPEQLSKMSTDLNLLTAIITDNVRVCEVDAIKNNEMETWDPLWIEDYEINKPFTCTNLAKISDNGLITKVIKQMVENPDLTPIASMLAINQLAIPYDGLSWIWAKKFEGIFARRTFAIASIDGLIKNESSAHSKKIGDDIILSNKQENIF